MFVWMLMTVYMTIIGSVGVDIVRGTCVPWGVYSSYTANTVVLMSAPVVLTTYNVPTGNLITSTFVLYGLCFVLTLQLYTTKYWSGTKRCNNAG